MVGQERKRFKSKSITLKFYRINEKLKLVFNRFLMILMYISKLHVFIN